MKCIMHENLIGSCRIGEPSSRRQFLAQALALLCGAGCKSLRASHIEVPTGSPGDGGDQICLSMQALSSRAEKTIGDGRALCPEVESLAGIGWLDGYVLDPENRDVILVGRQSTSRPGICFEDLLVNVQNVWEARAYPYCSLDPRPEDVRAANTLFRSLSKVSSPEQMRECFARLKNLWGPQVVVVGGVPGASRHGRVMVVADYHMKQLSQGHVAVPGVASYLDRGLAQMRDAIRSGGVMPAQGLSMDRFWFHVGTGEPTFYEGNGAVWLHRCTVVLLTEQQRAAADGTLHDSGGEDPLASAFANQVSRTFAGIAQSTRVYADLENLYRLQALLRAMRFGQAFERTSFESQFMIHRCQARPSKPMPSTLPGLVNCREETVRISLPDGVAEYVLHPMVCGGVGMDMQVNRSSFRMSDSSKQEELRLAAIHTRPNPDALYWPLRRNA